MMASSQRRCGSVHVEAGVSASVLAAAHLVMTPRNVGLFHKTSSGDTLSQSGPPECEVPAES